MATVSAVLFWQPVSIENIQSAASDKLHTFLIFIMISSVSDYSLMTISVYAPCVKRITFNL